MARRRPRKGARRIPNVGPFVRRRFISKLCELRLKKIADHNREDFDAVTVETVKRNFYVDDCLRSVATDTQAVRLAGQLRELLSKGGFRLTKWISNSREVINSVPESERAPSVKDLEFNKTSALTERALGVQWNVQADTFSFKIASKEKPATRRGILSIVSSIYDPLGFVSPCILPAKGILQDLCLKGLGWDDQIPVFGNRNGKPGLENCLNWNNSKFPDATNHQTSQMFNTVSFITSQMPLVKAMEQFHISGKST